ncbi:MAG: ATP-binding protein [bacterium]
MRLIDSLSNSSLLETQEFQSALVRMAVWVFMVSFLGLAGLTGYYSIPWTGFLALFGAHLVWYIVILIHIVRHPEPIRLRQYLALISDLSGTSFCILLGGEVMTPFYLFYIWIFISQGTRYGKHHLLLASLGSVVAYSIVLSYLGGWRSHPWESGFLMVILLLLPLYLNALIHRLHDATEAAESANRARGRFLATVTHELKTPLAGIVGMNNLLRDSRLDIDQQDYVDSIGASASQLQALIGDILDLSKMDANRLELNYEMLELEKELQEVCRSLVEPAVNKGLELVCDVDTDVPRLLRSDKQRLRQVLFNLIGNAVKFTHDGRVIVRLTRVLGRQGQEQIQVEVQDTGIGIPSDKVDQVFKVFWQGQVTRDYGGTGLGTTLARDLVQLMGGDIGVESERGKGSRFWFRLPLHSDDGEELVEPPRVLSGKHVLILEHDEIARAQLAAACRQAGMNVTAIGGMTDFDHANHGGLLQVHVDILVLADAPRGRDLEGEALMLRRLLGEAVPVLLLKYVHRHRHAVADNILIRQKPLTTRESWNALSQLVEPGESIVQVRIGRGVKTRVENTANILVAEDDPVNAKLLESLLLQRGYQVSVVMDGATALDVALDTPFDLALIDIRMPEMDGLEFTERYRASENGRRAMPIFGLTADMSNEVRVKAMDVGMNEYLTKPVIPKNLFGLMESYLS